MLELESLDYRTMLFMSSLLAVALSVLLLTMHVRIKTLYGLPYWVYANLLIGMAIIIFIIETIPLNIRAFLGGLSMVFGLALYFVAIKVFEQRKFATEIVTKVFLVILVINLAITLFSSNEYISILFNTVLCVLFSIMSGLLLLKLSQSRQKSLAHLFTGVFFMVFAGLTAYRLFILSLDQVSPVTQLNDWTQNEFTFLACMLSVLAINFGFTSMVNDRLGQQLSYAAGHDWLTGVMNRGRLEQTAELIISNSILYGQTQAMLLLDLDRFKRVNDTYGHLSGDIVIKKFAELLSDSIRAEDILGRFGGEEFCIVMPNTNERQAAVMAERIREQFDAMPIELDNHQIRCTVSIGVCDSSDAGNDFKDMFEAADKSLYAAKHAGRNKVILFSELLKAEAVDLPA